MEQIIALAKSDIGVAIAWLCSIGGIIFSIVTARENRSLKLKIKTTLNNSSTDYSNDSISQNGEKNVYTKNNSGGMNIKM